VNVINFACPVEVLIQECGIPFGNAMKLSLVSIESMAGAKLHLPFDDVEPLFLAAVHVLRRPDMSGWLVHPKCVGTVRVGAGGLERDSVVAHPPPGGINLGNRTTGASSSKRELISAVFIMCRGPPWRTPLCTGAMT
jgi:hypothetical protein